MRAVGEKRAADDAAKPLRVSCGTRHGPDRLRKCVLTQIKYSG